MFVFGLKPCEPATLARDAAALVAEGWHHDGTWPVDMFPQTYHIESVTRFRRATLGGGAMED